MSNVHQELGHITAKEPPQRSELARIAIGEVSSGLAKLASLGYNYRLVQGEASPGLEFPKMLYKTGQEPLIVAGPESEREARSDGWDDLNPAQAPANDGFSEPHGEGEAEAAVAASPPRVIKVEPAGGMGAVKEAASHGAAVSPGNT